VRLDGIDGSHLLGFMTALGVLRALDGDAAGRGRPRPKLAFDKQCIAHLDGAGNDQTSVTSAVVRVLSERAAFYGSDLSTVNKPADFTLMSFEEVARAATGWKRYALAGLACGTGDTIAESTLCAANGAGHQELIRSIRDVLELVKAEHLEAAMFRPWSRAYSVPPAERKRLALGTRKPTLRLDPADERLYALRANDPTSASSEHRTELGAQALAILAFELLPVCPSRRPTCIASRRGRSRVIFQWALWSPPATLAAVRSLLAAGPTSADEARARGAFAAFGAARVTGQKGKLSIAPTFGIW
jgi:hypothetical protein